MGLPIAASWLAGPAYHFMAVVHHAIPKISSTHDCGSNGFCADCTAQSLHQRFDHILSDWEKFYYQPRVYGSREKTAQVIEAMFEKFNPFSIDGFTVGRLNKVVAKEIVIHCKLACSSYSIKCIEFAVDEQAQSETRNLEPFRALVGPGRLESFRRDRSDVIS